MCIRDSLKYVTALPCKMHNFFIWLKVCCIPPNVGGSEKSRLWCVANGMSGKQHYSKCLKWSPSARIHASSLFHQWSTTSSTTLCWNSAHVTKIRFRNSSVSPIDTRYAWKNENDEKFVNFRRYKVVRLHFSGLVGKGVTVCFLLR